MLKGTPGIEIFSDLNEMEQHILDYTKGMEWLPIFVYCNKKRPMFLTLPNGKSLLKT